MPQTSENTIKKNRFQISREVQDDFVNEIAQSMLKLSKDAQKSRTIDDAQPDEQYSAATGFSYTGVNMARLMLSGMEKDYKDNRWMTFKQLQEMSKNHPALDMKIRKGEKGVKLLRSQEIKFIINADNKWEFPTDERIKELHNLQKQGVETPKINKRMLFYPFTVFNAEQIDGFPPKESSALKEAQSPAARNSLIETFISSSGVKVKHHENPKAYYDLTNDTVKMPTIAQFENEDAYRAKKLHLLFIATAHEKRENRDLTSNTYESVAAETMRGDMFSMLASARFGLPLPQNNSLVHIANWNQKFADGDTKNLFKAISDSAKFLTTMNQYAQGEQPKTKWFPKMDEWRQLEKEQFARNTVAITPSHNMSREEMDKAQTKDMQEIEKTNRIKDILNNPELLNQALAHLKNNPDAGTSFNPALTESATQRSQRARM